MVDQPTNTEDEWIRPTHQVRSREQRDRLLKAGERVFAEHGYWDSHVAQIVNEANCSVGSFYRRFKDKEALFFALQADMYERSRTNIERFFDSPLSKTRALTQILFHFIDNTADGMFRIKGYYRALFEISLKGRDVWLKMRDLEQLQAERIRLLLGAHGAKIRPDFLNAASLAVRAVNGMHISMMLHGAGPFEFDDMEGRKELTRILMRALEIEPNEAELTKLDRERFDVKSKRARRDGPPL
jgi:AcrR family transcriptional regulator